MTILVLSCGTRNKLIRFFRETLSARAEGGRVIAADCSPWAPALYEADAWYLVERMTEPGYLDHLLEICRKERVDAVLPLFEDELELIANNREKFEREGIWPVVSGAEAVELCRDKYRFYRHLVKNGLPALTTCRSLEEADRAVEEGRLSYPVFVKPVRGCGSAGIAVAQDRQMLKTLCDHSPEGLLIQQLAVGEEFGADLYVDRFGGKPVSIFVKKKVRMRAGETEKSLSFWDRELFELIERTAATLPLSGPVDMDLFRMDGRWYVSEINPRFGGGYPHAWHCGVNFPAMIAENAAGRENPAAVGEYEPGVAMMKYSDEIVRKMEDGGFGANGTTI